MKKLIIILLSFTLSLLAEENRLTKFEYPLKLKDMAFLGDGGTFFIYFKDKNQKKQDPNIQTLSEVQKQLRLTIEKESNSNRRNHFKSLRNTVPYHKKLKKQRNNEEFLEIIE